MDKMLKAGIFLIRKVSDRWYHSAAVAYWRFVNWRIRHGFKVDV